MAIEYLSYNVPPGAYSRFANTNGSNVSLTIAYDESSLNNGYYTVTNITGSYDAIIPQSDGTTTTVHHNVTGIATGDANNDADNMLSIGPARPYVTMQGIAFNIDGDASRVNDGSGSVLFYNLSDGGTPYTYGEDSQNTNGAQNVTESSTACFTTGTLIRTSRGAVAVEALRVGDLAVTASGMLRPIIWIGYRNHDGQDRTLPRDQQPIRIRADAFGPGLPARDLRLSQGHPVLVGADESGMSGVLVPIMCLINGTSIAREAATAATYWHVELDTHDILLAEGLPAESFFDMGSRAWFAGADEVLINPEFVPAGKHGRCRPVAVEGPVVDAERLRIDAVFAAELASHGAWSDADIWLAA